MSAELKRTGLPVGARVHHRGGRFSVGWTPEQQAATPCAQWGTIVGVDPREYIDGSREYLVQPDRALLPDMPNKPRWWASYHLDRWYVPDDNNESEVQ